MVQFITQQLYPSEWWGWEWNVVWPNSSTDWWVVLFDWETWKIIKDSWTTLTEITNDIWELQLDMPNKSTALHDDWAPDILPSKSWDIYTDDLTWETYISNWTDSLDNWIKMWTIDESDLVHKSWTETITWSKTFSGNHWDVEIPTWNSTPQVHITDDSSNTATHYYAWSIQNTVGWVTYNYSMPTKSSTLATLADISASWWWDVSWPNSSVNNNLVSFDWTTWKVIKDSALSVSNVALKSEIPDVIDNLMSLSETDALSANQWRILMDEIQVLQARGRYLSDWNAQTWLAKTLPKSWTTYIYNAWDYFIIYNAWTTNYRPDWSTYPVPVIPSVEVETAEVENWDTYVYDGSVWILQSNHTSTISFGNIQWQPSDNTNLANALNAKQNTLSAWTNISISGNTISATDTTYGAWTWISISWTTINNTWVTSVNGNTWAVSLNTINGTSLVWSWDIAVQPTLVSWTNIKTINWNSIVWSWDLEISWLPTQTWNTWKFLQTNWTSASWKDPNEFLTQAEYDLLTPVNWITYFIYEVEN